MSNQPMYKAINTKKWQQSWPAEATHKEKAKLQ
jgi:hypothetical protein